MPSAPDASRFRSPRRASLDQFRSHGWTSSGSQIIVVHTPVHKSWGDQGGLHICFSLWRPLRRSVLAFCDSSHITKTIELRQLKTDGQC